MYAYAWKALEVNDRFNCLIDFFVESFDWAAEMDREYADGAKPPLYGIPFSVKGNFFVSGFVQYCFFCLVGVLAESNFFWNNEILRDLLYLHLSHFGEIIMICYIFICNFFC